MPSDERVFFKLEGMPNLNEVKFLVFENLPIENFKELDLPKILPNLKYLQIRECPLKSLEGLPSQMPNLESITIGRLSKLQNLKGFPKKVPKFWIFNIINLPKLRSLENSILDEVMIKIEFHQYSVF